MSKKQYTNKMSEQVEGFMGEEATTTHAPASENGGAREAEEEAIKKESEKFEAKKTDKDDRERTNIAESQKASGERVEVAKEVRDLFKGTKRGEKRRSRTFAMSDAMYGKLKGLADENGISVSEVLNTILVNYM